MNKKFISILKESFIKYLNTSPRSNEKLKILHGYIAETLRQELGETYRISSINLEGNKEEVINGSYMPKKVDITISKNINGENKQVAGLAVKFVMSNYFQNSNNYFENMLGETANIRKAGIPYFQIFIIDHWLPYFDDSKKITKWEEIESTKLSKYKKLSFEDIVSNFFAPSKTFLQIINKNFKSSSIDDLKLCKNFEEYKEFCLNNEFVFQSYNLENFECGASAIINDYEEFIKYVVNEIKNI